METEENSKKTSFCAIFAGTCLRVMVKFARLDRGLVFRLLTGWSGHGKTAEWVASVDCLHVCPAPV